MSFRRRCGFAAVLVLVVGGLAGAAGPARRAEAALGAPRAPCGRDRVVYRAAALGTGGPIEFADETDRRGLGPALTGMLAHAAAASDVDGDGWVDLFVGTFADRPLSEYQERGADGPSPDRLLLGGPDGFRVDADFPGRLGRTSGAAFADLDGDGRPDLVVARQVRDSERGRAPSEVLRNMGGGRFEPTGDIPAPLGARSIGVLDFDADGRTDLFITEDRWTGGASVLLRNLGDFRFADVTSDAGLPTTIVGMGVATADLNGDGRPDLFVGGSNRFFLNDGNGRFHEGASSPFRWEEYGTEDDPAGVAAGDLNRDGRTDVVVGQHYGSTLDFDRRVPVRVYLNTGNDDAGDPQLRDVTDDAGLSGLPTKAPHVEIADFDSDGWPDILTTASLDGTTPVVFRNTGDGDALHFVSNGDPGSADYWPSGVVFDADHDGRLDVVLPDFDARRPTRLLVNRSSSGHWIGLVAERGSLVRAYRAGFAGEPQALVASADVAASSGFGGGSPAIAWLGLGRLDRVDLVVLRAGRPALRLPGRAADALIERRCTGG